MKRGKPAASSSKYCRQQSVFCRVFPGQIVMEKYIDGVGFELIAFDGVNIYSVKGTDFYLISHLNVLSSICTFLPYFNTYSIIKFSYNIQYMEERF